MAVERLPYQRDLKTVEALVASAQRTIAAQVQEALRTGDLNSARMRQAQLQAITRTLEQLAAELDPLAARLVANAWHQAARRAEAQVHKLTISTGEIPGSFAGVSTEAIQVMQASLTERLDSARQTVGRRVADVYAREQRRAALRAILGSEGSPGLASKHLADTLARRDLKRATTDARTGFVDRAGRRWSLDAYSNMAVRTITREAVVQGAIARMASHGIAIARVSTHPGSCEICIPYQGTLVSLDGSVTEWNGEAVSAPGEVPPYHPNMVPAGTIVQPVGRLRGGVRADWRGPLVDVTTASGIRLAIGPNHPVLTPNGWLPAKRLGRGDYVLRGGDSQRSGTRTGAREDLDQPPARVEDVLDALTATGVLARLVATTDHLHGDGGFCEGEIDVVRANGELWDDLDVEPGEHLREHVLVGAGVQDTGLARPRTGGLHLVSVGGAVGRPLPDLDPARVEPTGERRPRDWEAARKLLDALAGEIAADEIVDVRNVDWAGQAFDLETSEGSYFANGVYVSNCAHSLMPVAATVQSLREELENEPEGALA